MYGVLFMRMRYLKLVLALFALAVVGLSWSAAQQAGQNLLNDPGFESTNMKVVAQDPGEGTTFAVHNAWNGWYTESPRTEDWQNRIPNGTGRNNAGEGFVRSGSRSMELGRGYATFTAAVYQTVSVPQGSLINGAAWYVMDISEGASAQARVGIDPNGGTNPFDSDIEWSAWGGNQPVSSGWRRLSTTARASGGSVTLFLYATQRFPTENNRIFWDDAELVITETGTGNTGPVAPEPTTGNGNTDTIPLPTAGDPPTPTATRVSITPQPPNPDGSIVHIVSSGETLSAIARAYGVPLEDILRLNPTLGDGRLIRPGQAVSIRQARGATPPPQPTTYNPATFTPTPTPSAAPTDVAQANPDRAAICALLFRDANLNTLVDAGESGLPNGAISLRQEGEEVDSFMTDANREPFCFEDLQPGTYTVAGNPPPGHALTTSQRRVVNVEAGDRMTVNFGAAEGIVPTPEPTHTLIPTPDLVDAESTQGMRRLGLLIFGAAGAMLLAGVGIVFILSRRFR